MDLIMISGHILPLLFVILTAVHRSLGYMTCLSCTNVILPRDCNTIERCGPSSTCFTDGHITQLGTFRYNLGCRDVQQCTGSHNITTKRSTDVKICSDCCSGDLCNQDGCKTKGFLPLGYRGPICFNCASQQTTDDCQVITICGLGDVCKLKRVLYGQNNEIRYETKCEHSTKCYAEVNFYKPSSQYVGRRRRESKEFALGNTCMVQCCNSDLCNIGCKNTSAVWTPVVTPTPVKKPEIDVFIPNTTSVFYPIGSTVTLTCASRSYPVPSITWSRQRGGTSTIVIHSGTITLKVLQPSQLGSYTCTAHNAYGKTSKSITLVSNVTDVLDCNFDRLGTCLWINNPLDDGDWINSGVPLLTNTLHNIVPGPDNSTGNFLFTSSKAETSDQVVDLISPELGPSGPACLSFLYEIYRDSEQYLQIETTTNCEEYTVCNSSVPKTVVLHGRRINPRAWRLAQISLPSISHSHRLIIKSIHRPGLHDDDYCAIDTIRYYDGNCKPSLSLTGFKDVYVAVSINSKLQLNCSISGFPTPIYTWTKVGGCGQFQNFTGETAIISNHTAPGDGGTYICSASNSEPNHTAMYKTFHVSVSAILETTCTFEHGLCDWTQGTDDAFDWIANSGTTKSYMTGPDVDHTIGNASGTYLYTEASSPRAQGDAAVLRSHRMSGNQSVCFSFYYHMYGNDTGQLSVSIEDTCSRQQSILFFEEGDQGEQWLMQSVNITAKNVPHDYHIIIKGVVGKSYHGDMAIDDLLINSGTCV